LRTKSEDEAVKALLDGYEMYSDVLDKYRSKFG